MRILIVDDACGVDQLAGRGVTCAPPQQFPPDVATTLCDVDPAAQARPFSLDPQLPKSERAIDADRSHVFADAARGFRLGRSDSRGVMLEGIGVGPATVSYVLRSPEEGQTANLVVAPRFADEIIVGSDVSVEPPDESLPPKLSASIQTLKMSVAANLTPQIWNEVVTPTAMGHGPDIRPRGWLAVAGLAWLVVAISVLREALHRRGSDRA